MRTRGREQDLVKMVYHMDEIQMVCHTHMRYAPHLSFCHLCIVDTFYCNLLAQDVGECTPVLEYLCVCVCTCANNKTRVRVGVCRWVRFCAFECAYKDEINMRRVCDEPKKTRQIDRET